MSAPLIFGCRPFVIILIFLRSKFFLNDSTCLKHLELGLTLICWLQLEEECYFFKDVYHKYCKHIYIGQNFQFHGIRYMTHYII